MRASFCAALAVGLAGPGAAERAGAAQQGRTLVLPAMQQTGCRVPVLVLRCHGGVVELLYAFDMETDAAGPPRLHMAVDGAPVAVPELWPRSPSGRGVRVPAAVLEGVLERLAAGREVDFVLIDPASGSELRDGFRLDGLAEAWTALPCPLPAAESE